MLLSLEVLLRTFLIKINKLLTLVVQESLLCVFPRAEINFVFSSVICLSSVNVQAPNYWTWGDRGKRFFSHNRINEWVTNWYSYHTTPEVIAFLRQRSNCGCPTWDLYKNRNRMPKKNKPVCYWMTLNRFKWILNHHSLLMSVCETNQQKKKTVRYFIIRQVFEWKENSPFILLVPNPSHKGATSSLCTPETTYKQVHRASCYDYLRLVSIICPFW